MMTGCSDTRGVPKLRDDCLRDPWRKEKADGTAECMYMMIAFIRGKEHDQHDCVHLLLLLDSGLKMERKARNAGG